MSSRTGHSVKLGDDEREKIKRLAHTFHINESEVIRIAIRMLQENQLEGWVVGRSDGIKDKASKRQASVIPDLNKTEANSGSKES